MRVRSSMVLAIACCAATVAPAAADGPGVGTPTVVTVGDSAISGEAGRWAGNDQRRVVARRRARVDRLLGHANR